MRVSALQEEYLADDLFPPAGSEVWTDSRLRAWYENGGSVENNLRNLVVRALEGAASTETVLDAIHEAGVYSAAGFIELTDYNNLPARLTTGLKTRLLLMASRERSRMEAAKATGAAQAAEAEAERMFRIEVAVYNESAATSYGDTPDAYALPETPLPNGQFLSIRRASGEIGGYVWPSANLLTWYLHEHARSYCQGACVIEIGAGCGVCGLFAAGLGARQVVLTDVLQRADGSPGTLESTLLDNIERNREVCGLHAAMEVRELNFRNPGDAAACAERSACSGSGYDLILGSDITYEGIGVDFRLLIDVIVRLLRTSDPVSSGGLEGKQQPACALVAHETRLQDSQGKLAADGSDPAVAKLTRFAADAGLACSLVHDDRGRHQFACTGQRCILRLQRR